ncbi:PADRE domain [Dillenia turbinata]|uniref:PADRE domain n=1 Tax=Dillenia turbinata TaxID=194707 RepID=A0AAN8ZAL5_9MAGN
MGNCQAIDAAALVIQHPSGRMDRLYWPVTASEVMKMHPGHYVSLIIPLPVTGGEGGGEENPEDNKTVRFTRVKLLRPTDTLALGHAYRLVTTQEVMKVLRAKKYAKMKKTQGEEATTTTRTDERQSSSGESGVRSDLEKTRQDSKFQDDFSFHQAKNSDIFDQVGQKPRKMFEKVMSHERHQSRKGSTYPAVGRSKSWCPSLQSISEAAS